MAQETYTLDELSRHLGLDRRRLEKLVNRGRIPGRKIGSEWLFHQREITHWLEQEMREYTDLELAQVEISHQSTEVNSEFPVSSLLKVETVEVPLDARTKRSVLECLVEVAGRTWQIWEPATVLKAVQEREEMHTTAFPNGAAIPHPRNPLPETLGESVVAFGRTLSAIPFGGSGREMTDLFFLVLARDSRTHLQLIARISRMLQLPDFIEALRAAPDSKSTFNLICDTDERLAK